MDGIIFHLSAQPATQSKEISRGVTEIVVETVKRIAPNKAAELDISHLHHLLRKNAHFVAYFVLGILVMNALRRSRVYGYQSIALALLICALYAISDEIHQMYVPGRSGELRDVIIDSAGASVWIGVYLLVGKRRF